MAAHFSSDRDAVQVSLGRTPIEANTSHEAPGTTVCESIRCAPGRRAISSREAIVDTNPPIGSFDGNLFADLELHANTFL
jgi:hypothetical protein